VEEKGKIIAEGELYIGRDVSRHYSRRLASIRTRRLPTSRRSIDWVYDFEKSYKELGFLIQHDSHKSWE